MKAHAHYRFPAEWEKHSSVWLAWPSHAELWQDNLPFAQEEFTALCKAIVDLDHASGKARGESIDLLVPTKEARARATEALAGLPVRFHEIPFGDIWLRDTAPLFVQTPTGKLATASFKFNGWGGKYSLPHDAEVSQAIAKEVKFQNYPISFVLEGGSVEVDGKGTCLSSKQCLLNPNRNPGMDQAQVEAALMSGLGVSKVLWVTDGLLNDHTDGHIDTIARYVDDATILCMEPADESDPNFAVMKKIEEELRGMTDAQGHKIRVGLIPSPGEVLDEDGRIMPASYLNFYIANTTVIIPTYGAANDDLAVAAIAKFFPGRRTIGLSGKAILSGGGAFHCISQQQPLPEGK